MNVVGWLGGFIDRVLGRYLLAWVACFVAMWYGKIPAGTFENITMTFLATGGLNGVAQKWLAGKQGADPQK